MTPRVFSILERRPDVFRMLDKHQVRRAWNKAKADMGIDDPEFTPHALRHTFGTRLVQRGVAIYQVQKLMGHRSIKMTERYAKVFAEDLRGAIDVLAG